ncbi:MAG: hypothetical protein ACRC2T_14130 [Thermoguttaceae bacterium]
MNPTKYPKRILPFEVENLDSGGILVTNLVRQNMSFLFSFVICAGFITSELALISRSFITSRAYLLLAVFWVLYIVFILVSLLIFFTGREQIKLTQDGILITFTCCLYAYKYYNVPLDNLTGFVAGDYPGYKGMRPCIEIKTTEKPKYFSSTFVFRKIEQAREDLNWLADLLNDSLQTIKSS